MNAFNVNFGQDEGVVRRGAAPRANMERGDWHVSDEESDDDEPDMIDPAIAASSDEENDEDVDDSGYGSEESEAESAINQGHQEEESDEEMWRELDEAIRMMDDEEAREASSGRSSPEEYAPWEQNEIYEPPARLWEPARPPTPFRMVDSMSEASETAEMAVADEGAADGVASPPPLEPEGTDGEAEGSTSENEQWMEWWSEQMRQQEEAERELLRQNSCPVPYGHERYEAVEERVAGDGGGYRGPNGATGRAEEN
ncbi:uncharacterized protein Dwil_GK28011 [Drosophila willistoni]|uniref:Uncharacterized protein n=1 Tax=Drosophila willistoni TaxID=7260 RepID=A0A0Q9X2Y7_DROWI|nr:uncharacterized protein Dwil_GK28011 [Drosophila willistoni]